MPASRSWVFLTDSAVDFFEAPPKSSHPVLPASSSVFTIPTRAPISVIICLPSVLPGQPSTQPIKRAALGADKHRLAYLLRRLHQFKSESVGISTGYPYLSTFC